MGSQEERQRERRATHNQALFRSVNERLEQLNEGFREFAAYGSWMCECVRADCNEMIEMTLGEYEEVRRHPDRFAVVPDAGHVDPELEEVVDAGERYWTIEKIGSAAEVAHRLDERTARAVAR